jgi:DNA-binding response OmpR family regulator
MLSRALEALRSRRRTAILLVEDELTDRLAIENALSRAGHRVIPEAQPDRAADLLCDGAYPLTCLITSVELGIGRSGWELASLAREVRPDIPVIYLNRYSEGAWPTRGVLGSRLVQKPVDPQAVAARAQSLMEQNERARELKRRGSPA